MRTVFWLAWRDLLRCFRSPLGLVTAALYYLAQAVLFYLYVTRQVGPQPQSVPVTTYMYSSGLPMIVLGLFLPALAMRAFAEERQLQTWPALACMGLSEGAIVLGKFLGVFLQLLFWLGLALAMPLSLLPYASIDGGALASAVLGVALAGAQWTALLVWLTCRTGSMMSAYLVGALVLVVAQFAFFLKVALPDKFYRPLLDAIDLPAFLARTCQGVLSLPDLLFMSLGTVLLLLLARQRLAAERSGRSVMALFGRWFLVLGGLLALYLVMVIAEKRPVQWHVAALPGERLSPGFRDMAAKLPAGIRITTVLPRQANTPEYDTARNMILTFLDKIRAANPRIGVDVCDPDVDILGMERLAARMKDKGSLSSTKIGGLVLEFKERTLTIPYHMLVSLGTTTVDNEAVRYISAFHGEEQLGRSLVSLLRQGGAPRALFIGGSGELDPADKGRTGGSDFALLLEQMGFSTSLHRPGVDDMPDMKDLALVIWLDPVQKVTEQARGLLDRLFQDNIPVLAASGVNLQGEPARNAGLFSRYGIDGRDLVVVQGGEYRQLDFLTLPVEQTSTHPIMQGLDNLGLLLTNCTVLAEGVAGDPRLVAKPLLRTRQSNRIWGEANLEVLRTRALPPPDDADKPSPLVLAWAVHRQLPSGVRPLLAVFASRSPFENRFLDVGACRNMLFKSVDWLCFGEGDIRFPPQRLVDYRINMRRDTVLLYQALICLVPPFLLVLCGLWLRRRNARR